MTRKGFTLIELLVVIAIIAILAAILFPVFISAKDSAKWRVCGANLKEIGISYRMYCDDYEGLAPQFTGSYGDAADPTPLIPYAKSKKANSVKSSIWACPGDKDVPGQSAIYKTAGSSYMMWNLNDSPRSNPAKPARPDQWAKPTRDYLASDCLYHFHRKKNPSNWAEGDNMLCLNVLMIDGHIRAGTRVDKNLTGRDAKDIDAHPGALAYTVMFDNPFSYAYNPGHK